MATSKSVEVIEIRPIEVKRATVRIVGDTPLIMHAWSEKAKREMLEKQMKVTKTKAKAAKDPIEDFIRSMYWKTPMPTDMTQAGFERAISEGARPLSRQQSVQLFVWAGRKTKCPCAARFLLTVMKIR